jgi:hypothetical protein
MKCRDEVIRTTAPNAAPPRNLTSPDIATTPTVVSEPVGWRVTGGESNQPQAPMPTPPEWSREDPSNVRPGLGGDDNSTGTEAAPTDNPAYNPTATEYRQPGSNLPMQVSQSTILAQNEDRGDNMWPGNRSPLAGTVNDGFARLRRRAGGE